MRGFARILCAIDLDKASDNAFDRALSLAVLGRARLFLLHAVPANVAFSTRAGERLAVLNGLRERARTAGVPVRIDEQHGDPADLILLHAESRRIDIVVLGSNRRRGWQRFREGSVSEQVLRRARWPVVIVPWDAPRAGILAGTRTRLRR